MLIFMAGTNGTVIQCVDIGIINTPTMEENETFVVILSTPPVVPLMLENNVTTVTITDTDSKYTSNSHSIIASSSCSC